MPIEISLPAVADLPFGPGASFFFVDTTVGPHPVDDQVTLTLYAPDGETVLTEAGFVNVTGNSFSGAWLVPTLSAEAWNYIRDASDVETDALLQLVARRKHADSTLVSQDSVRVKWAPERFVWYQQFYDLFTRGQGQGGFTATDRTTLQTTQDNTRVEMPTEIAAKPTLSNPIADWLTLSHGTAFVRTSVQLLSGRGSLSVHTPQGVAFGFVFSWFTVPAELGKADGLQPVYDQELFQVGIVYADGGLDLYYDRLLGYQTDGHFVEWPNLRWPERVDYWVYPGVVVALQFMTARVGSQDDQEQ